MGALTIAIQVIEALTALVPAGVAALDRIESTVSSLKLMQSENRDPTDEEWAALNQVIEDLRAARPDLDQ